MALRTPNLDLAYRFFQQSKYTSFRRQLNIYGFNRLYKGRDKKGYFHELFLRGKEPLAYRIVRLPVNGRRFRVKLDPELEPDFYAMESVDGDADGDSTNGGRSTHCDDDNSLHLDQNDCDLSFLDDVDAQDVDTFLLEEQNDPSIFGNLDQLEHELVSLRQHECV